MMAIFGATHHPACAVPFDRPKPWTAFLKASPVLRVRVEAQSWDTACELGRRDLGVVLLEDVDAKPAQEGT